ncbi:hypothetical protein [Luteolibacter sp. AS25]|uniref:hypothetical protein n=1 Tax=Luteolibacter sp. AS25 TaxID=3135776 RepID=UPI00398A9AE7
MAKSIKTTVEISELIAQGKAARLQLGKSHAELKHKLDFPNRLRESVKAEPTKWIGGSAAAGLVGSFLFRRKKKPQELVRRVRKVKKQRNLLLATLGLGFTVVKPVAKIYATKLLKDYFKNQITRGTALRPSRDVSPR